MELKSSGFKRRKKSITMYSYISIRDGRKKCLNLEKNWMHASYMSIDKLRVIPLLSSKLRSMRQLDMWLWYSDIAIQRTSVYFKISRRCIKVKKKRKKENACPLVCNLLHDLSVKVSSSTNFRARISVTIKTELSETYMNLAFSGYYSVPRDGLGLVWFIVISWRSVLTSEGSHWWFSYWLGMW